MTTLGVAQPFSAWPIRPLFGYTEYTFNVTASSASTALQFEGFSIADAWLLDDVSVNPAEWVSLMAARQFVCSVSLCSA